MNTKIYKQFFLIAISGIIFTSSFAPILPKNILPQAIGNALTPKTAQAMVSPAGPTSFGAVVRDLRCAQQQMPRSYVTANSSAPVTDNNAKDPDCGSIIMETVDVSQIPLNQSIYTQDFRIGTKLAESENGCNRDAGEIRYTPWASEGGGSSWGATAQSNVNDPDCLWIYYETRPLPAGIIIKDVRAGISTGYGAMQYTSWARSAGGIGEVWSGYSGGGNISPARVALDVQFTDIYDAEYVSDTIPDTMLQSQSGSYNIVMKNKATAWLSNNQSPVTDSCQSQTPTAEGQTCSAEVVLSSSTIKLRQLGNDSQITLSAGPYIYKRSVTRNYRADLYCVQWGLSYNDRPANIFGFKEAKAIIPAPTDPDPEPDVPTCTGYGFQYYLVSQSPVNNNIINTDTGTFPLNVTINAGASNGIHTLNFQMAQYSNTGTFIQDFGTPAAINITVGSSFGLVCGADASVPVGTEAQYAITASGSPSASISVTMSSSPTGPTMTNSPLVLSGGKGGNGYSGIAYVATSGLSSSTQYTLTFTGNDGVNPAVSCQSRLSVFQLEPQIDLKFNASDEPVVLKDTTSGTISWLVRNATSCNAATDPDPNTVNPAWDLSYSFPVDGNGLIKNGSDILKNLAYNTAYSFTVVCYNNKVASSPDTVYVSTTATNPTADIKCSQGGAAGTDGPCTVNSGAAGAISLDSTFAVSCTIQNVTAGTPPISAPLTTNGGTISTGNLSANTTFKYVCVGQNGTTPASDTVNFTIQTPPQRVTTVATANNGQCGTIDISWVSGGSPVPDYYMVYYINSGNTPTDPNVDPTGWTALTTPGQIPGSTLTYRHTNPGATGNYYAVRPFHDGLAAQYTLAGGTPIAVTPCSVNVSTSDKDIISVQRGNATINTVGTPAATCSGASEVFKFPKNGLFQTNDIVTFKINICNSGNQTLTNVRVVDTLTNLTSMSTPTFSPAGCGTASDTTFNLSDMASKTVCSITFSAKVTAPGSAASLYRFQNTADLSSAQANLRIYTPPYLFQAGAGVPNRNETPPK